MKLIKIVESIQIARPPEQVFDYTQDYRQRLVWDTFLRVAKLLDGATEAGKGARSWCVSKHGIGMETEYVTFSRPTVAAIRLMRPTGLFLAFAGSWRFEDTGTGSTTAIFTYAFTLRRPLMPFSLVVRTMLAANVRGRLRDLKATLETC